MGVSVRLGYTAVGGPTGVADADVAEQAFFFGCIFHQLYAANTANAFDFAVYFNSNTGRVVASVFETFKTVS